jgi:hypothetical protein
MEINVEVVVESDKCLQYPRNGFACIEDEIGDRLQGLIDAGNWPSDTQMSVNIRWSR